MEHIQPDQAADALRVVAQRQEQVIDLAAVPAWYWAVVGALMVVLAAGIDSHKPLAIGIAVSVFVCGLLGATARVVYRVATSAQLHHDLVGPRGVGAILAFVFAIDVPTIGAALALRAAGVHYAATIACAVAGTALALGGPVLIRHLRRTMLAGRVGEKR
jgi:hypothetical protein